LFLYILTFWTFIILINAHSECLMNWIL
jgi:hypothetical protein